MRKRIDPPVAPKPKNVSLIELDLSVRSYNALRRSGHNSAADITDQNRFAWQMLGQYLTTTGICWKVDPEETGAIKIDEAAIPLADVAEITASDESLFRKDEWEGC